MRKLSGRRGKRNLKLRKGLRRRERSGVIVAERIKVETGVLLVGWRSWWGQKKGEREEVLAGEMGEESGGPMGTRGKGGYDRRRDDDGPPARCGSPPPPRRGSAPKRGSPLPREMHPEVGMVELGEGEMLPQEALLQDADHHQDR